MENRHESGIDACDVDVVRSLWARLLECIQGVFILVFDAEHSVTTEVTETDERSEDDLPVLAQPSGCVLNVLLNSEI